MLIEEAIKHCEEKAKCGDSCGREHKQLADWLRELMQLRYNIAKADYKEACGRLQTANLIKDEQLAATRHQKYKRCLAMAKWCDAQVEWYNSLNEDYSFWLELYVKWHNRWLELAEKFKEAK